MLFSDREWILFAAGCYLGGLVFGTVSLVRTRRHSRWLMYAIMAVGYMLHTWGLVLRGRAAGGCPLGNTFEILQFASWSAITLYLVIGATFRLSLLGYFTSGLATILTGVSVSVGAWDKTRAMPVADSPFVSLHAGLAMFSYGVFGLLALTSLMLLFRHHSLKSKHLGGWFSMLPSLMDLDHIGVRLLTAGVALMSAALGVGYIYWSMDNAYVQHAKLAAVIGLWVGYAVTLALRRRGLLVGPRFAWFCLSLYLAALLSLWPVNRSRGNTPRPVDHPPVNHPAQS